MAYEFKFPFEPPWDDLKRTVETSHGMVYIFDTCVERDPAKRAAIDKRVGEILGEAERKKYLKSMGSTA